MHIDWQIAPLQAWNADALLLFAFEKATEPLPGVKRWMEEKAAWLSPLMALQDFQGKYQQVAVYYGPSDENIPRVICVGLGTVDAFDLEKLRGAAASALRKCRELQLKRPGLPLIALHGLHSDIATVLEETLIGGITGLYRFDALKTTDREPLDAPEVLSILADNEPGEAVRAAVATAEATSSAIFLTRDLVVAPANQVTPAFLVKTAYELAEKYAFKLQIIDFEQAQAMGMGAFTAVARGSQEPAYMVVLEHVPSGTEGDQPLVFVGKGITFDTGGISIKPSNKMDAMKQDMAGAAAVLGAFKILGELKIRRRVAAILPCTENMPDGKAYKPGDVIRTLAGLTVEIISTDAEGRMVLCDALAYALRLKPAAIVDIATLTGACIVALGDQVGAVMGNQEWLVQSIQEIGMQVGDRLWPLPLWDFYFEGLKSDVADFRNVGDRKAGAIIGGMFLKQFVTAEIPWVHLDIAGPAWTDKDLATTPKGATGFGVRILAELARRGLTLTAVDQ